VPPVVEIISLAGSANICLVSALISISLAQPKTPFRFYSSVFKTDFWVPIARFKDIPPLPGCPPLAEADQNLVMHVELPVLGGHVLMGTDAGIHGLYSHARKQRFHQP
jgi:hypothetical protein